MTKFIKTHQKTTKPQRRNSDVKIETNRDGKSGNTKHSSLDSEQNSKQGLQRNNWCFTWNNYPTDFKILLETSFKLHHASKYVFQPEIGELETPHIQGAVWFPKKCRWTEFKLPKQIRWSAMKKEENSEIYCQKPREQDGLIEGGECTKFGCAEELKCLKPCDFAPFMNYIMHTILSTEPDCRKVHWFWEPIGRTGKSQFARYLAIHHRAVCIQEGKRHDIAHLICTNRMHATNKKIVIIDIPRLCGNRISWSAVECIKNGHMTNMKYEPEACLFNPPHVIIFSNFAPEQGAMSGDRVIVYEIGREREPDYAKLNY